MNMDLKRNKQTPILTIGIIICSLIYAFFCYFDYPFESDLFLYAAASLLVIMTLYIGKINFNLHTFVFLALMISCGLGSFYTTMPEEGTREAIWFLLFFLIVLLAYENTYLIKSFVKWTYFFAIFVSVTVIVQSIMPDVFHNLMKRFLMPQAYDQLILSYEMDEAYAGICAYTPNAAFFTAIVFGQSFMNIIKKESAIIPLKVVNILLMILSLYVVILTSKRGIFVAILGALFILFFYVYRKRKFALRILGLAVVFLFIFNYLYESNVIVASFLDRFLKTDDLTTGRDVIYRNVYNYFTSGDIYFGRGTGATYRIANTGAHNIYLQILCDHGVIFSIPYYIFLIYNYYLAFKNKCPISIFVQSMFLIYGMSGNPLYTQMFMIIYIYYILYALRGEDMYEDRNTNISQCS